MQPDRTAHKRAVTRKRVARWRNDQKINKLNPVRHDDVIYDGAMLNGLVVQRYITEADTADQAKVNAALTQKLRDDTCNALHRCPRCGFTLGA